MIPRRASLLGMAVGCLVMLGAAWLALHGLRGTMLYLAHGVVLDGTAMSLVGSVLVGMIGLDLFDEASRGAPPWLKDDP